jgi:hypothetical protein
MMTTPVDIRARRIEDMVVGTCLSLFLSAPLLLFAFLLRAILGDSYPALGAALVSLAWSAALLALPASCVYLAGGSHGDTQHCLSAP